MKKLNENTIRVKQMMRKVDDMLEEAFLFGKLGADPWEEIAHDKAKYDRMRSRSTASAMGSGKITELDMKIEGTGKWGDILQIPEDPKDRWKETNLWNYKYKEKLRVKAKFDDDRKLILIDSWKKLPENVEIKFETQNNTPFKLNGAQTEFCFFWKEKDANDWEGGGNDYCGVDFAIWEVSVNT